MNRGQLIAFEGIDGCGKSTQLERLAASLREAGQHVTTTREPSDGTRGQKIRAMARAAAALDPAEELRCFVDDRRAHVAEVIEPARRDGAIVLTDRYYLSSVAYQGARGLDFEKILSDSEAEFPIPDLVVLLEIEPALALTRVHQRGGVIEGIFEREDFLKRVADIFAAIDRPYVERIGAEGAVDTVHEKIAARVRLRIGL